MKQSIQTKLLFRLIVFTVLLSGGFCVLVSYGYYRNTSKQYEYLGDALTGSMAAMISGDRAEDYLESREKDDYYQTVGRAIYRLDQEFETQAIYVAVPEEDQLIYLWSDDQEDTEETLGYTETITKEESTWLLERMNGSSNEVMRYFNDPVYGRIVISCMPILNSEGKAVAMAMVDFSANEILKNIIRIILMIALIAIVLTAIYTAVFYIRIKHTIIQPVQQLTQAAETMTENLDSDAVYHSGIRTGDELETLSRSFEKMNEDLRRYLADNLRITAERERMDAELNLAASIQIDQLPRNFPPFPDRKDLDIYAIMTPAKTVGGDFYDFFLIDDSHLAMVIADVSGKGVPASLFMMVSRILIKNCLLAGNGPARTLSIANGELMEGNETGQFVTVWLAVLDMKTGKGIAANAGHEHPALRRAGGRYELVEYRHAPPVAIMEMTRFTEHPFELFPGDSFLVYTDGVTEATDARNQLFGTDRMLEALNREPDADAQRTLENVMDGIREFVGDAEQFDDITMLGFRYLGPEAQGTA